MNYTGSYKVIRNAGLLLSIILFTLSFPKECFCASTGCASSLFVVLSGWLGVLLELGTITNWLLSFIKGSPPGFEPFIGATLTWLANPLLIMSWFALVKKPRRALWLSSCAFIIALSFLLFKKVIVNEGGHYGTITSYQLGYWLWLASILITVACTSVLMIYLRKLRKEEKSRVQSY